MTKRVICLLLVCVFLFIGCNKREEKEGLEKGEIIPPIIDLKKQAPPGVFLVVNGKEFKKDEFNRRFDEIWQRQKKYVPQGMADDYKQNLKAQMIERIIIQTLCEEEAKRKNVTVTTEEVDREWSRLKSAFKDEKKWEDFVNNSGMKREDIKTALLINKLVEIELGPRLNPTAKEIRSFYDHNKDMFTKPERAHVRHILVAVLEKEDPESRAKKRERIEAIRRELLKGKDFAQAAREYSDCVSKAKGGDLGEIYRPKEMDAFSQAVFSQKIGEIGPIVESKRGFHIIQVLEKKPQERIPFNQVKAHIAELLKRGRMNEAYEALISRLKKTAIIVKFYDP